MTNLRSFRIFTLCFGLCFSAGSAFSENPTSPETEQNFTVDLASPADKTAREKLARFKALAAGVGWEFSPDSETDAGLKSLGMRVIRCINVDRLKGTYEDSGAFHVTEPPRRLLQHLETCRKVGAVPHVIFAMGVPDQLRVSVDDAKERLSIMGQTPGKHTYWNGDWKKLRAYWKEMFRYVLLEKGFPDARFEVGNEPDIDGQFPRLVAPQGKMGSRQLYDSYSEVYRHAAQAAREFEAENPGTHVTLGGPALAWAYTFSFGELNWLEQFLKDCAKAKTKLDFVGIHYYGNISSLDGSYKANFPSFAEMFGKAKLWRDQYQPGVPIHITEWGPSYHTNNQPKAWVNADHIGAAWCAEFLLTMLNEGVAGSLYLVTTDLRREGGGNLGPNVWGWPSLYVSPAVFGKAWPKAPHHVFSMIRKLSGAWTPVETGGGKLHAIASSDQAGKKMALLIWNYDAQIPEGKRAIDNSVETAVRINIKNPGEFFQDGTQPALLRWLKGFFQEGAKLGVRRWLVSETTSNAFHEFRETGQITDASLLTMVDRTERTADQLGYQFTMPPSGVALIEFEERP